MRKVIVITGDNMALLEKAVKEELRELRKELDIRNKKEFIMFPEKDKHPREWSKDLRNTLKSNTDTTYIVVTFHEDVFNLLGHMIYKNELKNDEIEIIVETKDEKINSNFDDEGYLENYPYGYLDIDIEN